jgi:glycosyltransferase involved in cell wall biosynthesis
MTTAPLRRIFYAAANGDLIGSFEHWRAGAHIEKEVARTYSGELFDFCAAHAIRLLAVSPSRMAGHIRDATFDIRHVRVETHHGVRYHLFQLLRSVRLLWMILRFRPDVAILSDRLVYWWALAPLRLVGIRLVIAMHVRLWLPEATRPGRVARVLMALDRWFLHRCASGMLAVSRVVADDLGGIPLPAEVFTPLYDPAGFAGISPPAWEAEPFRLLFMGRVEANKGVFNMLEALALALARLDLGRRVHLDLVGDGGAMAELKARIVDLDLGEIVTVHGQLTQEPLLELLSASSAVIVPTRSDMGEGYNKVAAEAVLAGRPVIASDKCPIVADIGPAAISVPADDIPAYAEAIRRLAMDRPLFEALAAGTHSCRQRFFQRSNGYAAACARLFARIGLAPVTHSL